MTCRGHYKDFFFTSGFRNVTVLNPSLEVPQETRQDFKSGGRIQYTPSLRGTAGSSTWSAGRRRRRRWPAGRGRGRTWSLRTTRGPGSNPPARGGSNKPSHRSQCSLALTTGEEETVAEADSPGEVPEEAWATTSLI